MAEQQQTKVHCLYDPRRALEDLQKRGEKPIRFFAILFPLWDIETTATQTESRDYQLLEKYVERGLFEGQLHTVQGLSTFFGLQEGIIEKILGFLLNIKHVKYNSKDRSWELDELGKQSLASQHLYEEKEKRVRFYFDAYSSQPLLREHYERKSVHILSSEEMLEVISARSWGYHFYPLSTRTLWRPQALAELESRVDKGKYNVPAEMKTMRELNVSLSYLPMYIVETMKRSYLGGEIRRESYYIVYTGIQERHDSYFELLINRNRNVLAALKAEQQLDQAALWTEWLKEKGISGEQPEKRPDETWQITLPASVFEPNSKKISIAQIGDYELRQGYFIQIWCNDVRLRRKAALDRCLRMVKYRQQYIKRADIEEQLQRLTEQLQIEPVDFGELKQRAEETKQQNLFEILERAENSKRKGERLEERSRSKIN